MNDPISRQAAIDELEERIRANGYSNVALVSELNRSIGYIMRLPAIDPVKHGRWITKDGGKTTVCSLCGDIWGKTDFVLKYLHYCPNCGAIMDGERSEKWPCVLERREDGRT